MKGQTRHMLQYFRTALSAQQGKPIDFRKTPHITLTSDEWEEGVLEPVTFQKFYGDILRLNQPSAVMPVLLCVKSLCNIYSEFSLSGKELVEKIGLFYVPALLTESGKLRPPVSGVRPWFAMELLRPNAEPVLSIGAEEDAEAFLESSPNLPTQWADYLHYCGQLYRVVTSAGLSSEELPHLSGPGYRVDSHICLAVFEENMPSSQILPLYDYLLEQRPECPLLDRFTGIRPEPLSLPVEAGPAVMQRHRGHMRGDASLTDSQREIIHHAISMEQGEILVVHQPPTTDGIGLIQALAANALVACALDEEPPPFILIVQSESQRLATLADAFSFGRLEGPEDVCKRWLRRAGGLAVRMSAGRMDPRLITSPREAEEEMLTHCSEYFGQQLYDIEACRRMLHSRLVALEGEKNALLNFFYELEKHSRKDRSLEQYGRYLRKKIQQREDYLAYIGQRQEEWREYHSKISPMGRLFREVPAMARKAAAQLREFATEEELTFLLEPFSLQSILTQYDLRRQTVEKEAARLNAELKTVERLMQQLRTLVLSLRRNGVELMGQPESLSELRLEGFVGLLDRTLRRVSFWLALHYYECRWLEGDYADGSAGAELSLRRTALLTPCLLSDYASLPSSVRGKDQADYPVNYADLLILGQAETVPPEAAACVFALGRKAVVMGDTARSEPVWGIPRYQDMLLAQDHDLIATPDQFVRRLMESGLYVSGSSLMLAAMNSCRYGKYHRRGLYLRETGLPGGRLFHFCSQLSYEAALLPAVNSPLSSGLPGWPAMAHQQVSCVQSAICGNSRYNLLEAREIARWVARLYPVIRAAYPDVPAESLLNIMTPFSAQVVCIRHELHRLAPDYPVRIGTMQAFSKARPRVLLFSGVYGSEEDAGLIRDKKELLNRALLKDLDHFFLFGDQGCLSASFDQPDGLLRSYLAAAVPWD